jgi:hypothetical protein
MTKDHASPKTKTNHNKRQTQSKTPTLFEVESTWFHQMGLGKSQDKYRPLKQSKLIHIWPKHKCHKSENNHQRSQTQPTHHPQQEKYGLPHQLISRQW